MVFMNNEFKDKIIMILFSFYIIYRILCCLIRFITSDLRCVGPDDIQKGLINKTNIFYYISVLIIKLFTKKIFEYKDFYEASAGL